MNHTANKQAKEADATVTLSRATFNEGIMGGKPKLEAKMASGDLKLEDRRRSWESCYP